MDAIVDTASATTPTDEPNGWEWAIVEVFGHRRHAGRIREEERFGAKLLRVDVPTLPAGEPNRKVEPADVTGWTTHWYGGAAIFSLTHTDEATVLRANRPAAAPGRYLPARSDEIDGFPDDADDLPY